MIKELLFWKKIFHGLRHSFLSRSRFMWFILGKAKLGELKPFPKLQHFFFPTDGIFSRGEFIDALKHAGFTILVAKSRYKFVVLARKPIKRSFVTKV